MWYIIALSLPRHKELFSPVSYLHRDSEWTRIQTTAARKTLLLGQIKMATHNLYTLMYKHLQRKVPLKESEDTMMQLGRVRELDSTGSLPSTLTHDTCIILLSHTIQATVT